MKRGGKFTEQIGRRQQIEIHRDRIWRRDEDRPRVGRRAERVARRKTSGGIGFNICALKVRQNLCASSTRRIFVLIPVQRFHLWLPSVRSFTANNSDLPG
jgi:hypothetical protein